MRVKNELYKNQGIHVISSIFTVTDGVPKVLLIRRKNNPYKDMWGLVGGALYNNESLEEGLNREIFEKTGLKKVRLFQFGTFDEMDKTPGMRMVAVCYIGVINAGKAVLSKENRNTTNVDWFPLDRVPKLAFNHNLILKNALEELKLKITQSDILKVLFNSDFTMPELQKVYEGILARTFDRRNFRKKILSLGIVYDTNKFDNQNGSKPAKLYRFKDKIEIKKVL